MKQTFLFFSLWLYFSTFFYAQQQEPPCKTPQTSPNNSYNTIIASAALNSGGNTLAPKTLRVYFHVIRRWDGSGGYLPFEVEQSFNILQEHFNEHGIYFAWDGCINYIDNYNYFTVLNTYTIEDHDDGIDIYLHPASHSKDAGQAGDGVGVGTALYVSGNYYGAMALTSTISHEMGHVLFLYHTHLGCELGDWDLTNGTDCVTAGDFVCDTPVDPGLWESVNSDCEWDYSPSSNPMCSTPEALTAYNPDTKLIMSYARPPCREYFSLGQFERMHLAINLLPHLQACVVTEPIAIEPCDCPPEDIVFSENRAIDEDLYVSGNIKVINGAKVTVSSSATVYLTEEHGIDVYENSRLIVDGGTLTACDNTWRGIKVAGGNSDYDVKFTNGAIIKNVDGSAVSMFAPYPWPDIQQYGNGILQADNTSFYNVKRMVEFMSWSPLPNPSYVRNCVHNGGKWSITNWNCQNIEITDNVFNDISHNSIGTETGSFLIQGNEFNSGQNDILFNNVSAGFSTEVRSNQFFSTNIGYHARGTTFAQNEISDNIFQTGNVDVLNDDHNSYLLERNIISSSNYGAVSSNNGILAVDVRDNEFRGNKLGLLTAGYNKGLNFSENCYETTVFDNYINGQISPVVHSGGGAANNCFTHGGNINATITDIGGIPEPFAYLEPNDELRDCRDAILAHPNVNRVNAFNNPPLPTCTQGIINNPDNDQYCWPNPDNYEAVQNAYTWLQDKLNAIEQNTNLSEAEKAELISIYSKCLKRVKGYLFEQYAATGDYQQARSLYQKESGSDDAKVFVFSSYILENNLAQARTYLNALAPYNEQMLDFITIQNINLDRLPYGPFYDATMTELNTVRSIAIKTHPYAAYAKALYYVLTGEIISSELPVIENGGERRPHFRTQVSKETKIYPNPFDATLQIDIVGEDVVVLDIYDMFGQKVYSVTTEPSSMHINTATWKAGMYLINIKNQDEIIKTEKVLLVR